MVTYYRFFNILVGSKVINPLVVKILGSELYEVNLHLRHLLLRNLDRELKVL